jgi:hypothetical protein
MRRVALIVSFGLLFVAPALASAQTLTAPQYLTQANGICAAANTRTDALVMPKGHSAPALAKYVSSVVSVSALELNQLQALSAPEPLQTEASGVYALVAQSNTLQRQMVAAIKRLKGGQAARLDQQVDALLSRANVGATAIGLTTCAD